MGTVWRAFDQLLEAEVALKEIEFAGGVSQEELADRVERALREARHATRLRAHPNVVTILDVVLENGLPWIVMELVPSRSLFDVVRDDGPLPPVEVARVGLAMVDALSAAASFGILHRDVKPSNVLMAHDGRVVLTDFGIATSEADPKLTVTGVIGTPLYMAPERLNNEPASLDADLFSLGGTLYFAVEGRAPFARESFSAMLAAIVLVPAPAPERAGPVTDVVMGLLEKDPATRLKATDARQMLLDVLRAADADIVDLEATTATARRTRRQAATGARITAHGANPRVDELTPTDLAPRGSGLTTPIAQAAAAAVADLDETLPQEPALGSLATPTSATPGVDTPSPGSTAVRPAPPTALVAEEEDGAIALRWAPSPTPGVVYRVYRLIEDPSAPNGWRSRGLGTTGVRELVDGGVPKGATVRHEVVAILRDSLTAEPVMSLPASTGPITLSPTLTGLRADLSGDAIAISWRPIPGHDDVIIERVFDPHSSFQGAIRRFRASGGQFLDQDIQPGAIYRYRVWLAPAATSTAAALDPEQAGEVRITAVPRPRPVTDVECQRGDAGVMLRWTTVPNAVVRIYATPATAGSEVSGAGPLGPKGHEVRASSFEGRARLVGESRRGRVLDAEAGSEAVVYTPVSVAGDRAVIGTAVLCS